MAAADILWPLYIVLTGASRGLISRHMIFYVYLIQLIAADAVSWMAFAYYGPSSEYAAVYRMVGLVTEVFGMLVVIWLAGRILRPYPSLRLSVLIVMFTSYLVATGWIWLVAFDEPNVLRALHRRVTWDLRVFDSLFIALLTLLVIGFKLPVGMNLRGILGGYGLHVLGLCLIETAKRLGWLVPPPYLGPATYFVMLGILMITLRQYRPGNQYYVHPFLMDKIDVPLFPILVRAGIWNRYTYRLLSQPAPPRLLSRN